ncbi:MAG: geranylgeranylglycerol-phosphate geranylgeranyltransferase [Moraxellaceae bacterium]
MHLLKLTRPINLIVIALTMVGIRFLFLKELNDVPFFQSAFEQLDFFLLVFSTVLIAAGGNIINDYFDVKADKINKPNKVIIGKFVKPRLAIVLHWILNFLAFSIALYLSWKQHSFWYLFIHLFSINALWIYSTQLKRRFLIGNIVIAALTGLVPILSALYFINSAHIQVAQVDLTTTTHLVIFLAVFAAILNLIREIIKDMEDVKGDLLLRATTIPIKIGLSKTKRIVSVLLIATLSFSSILVAEYLKHLPIFHLIATISMAICLIISIYLVNTNQLKLADRLLKITMVIGCTLPFYL